jgi:hypothetical protein
MWSIGLICSANWQLWVALPWRRKQRWLDVSWMTDLPSETTMIVGPQLTAVLYVSSVAMVPPFQIRPRNHPWPEK